MGKLLAVCTLLAGLLVTGLVGHEAVRRDQEQLAGATQERVTLLAAQVRQRLVAYELALRGGASLFAATTHPTRVQWAAYVDALALDDAYPGVQGVAFATWLPRQRIGDLEWAMHDEGFPDFRVWPRHDGEASSAIVYIEPLDQRNRRALGFDMYSEKIRSEAMAASRDLGTPALTGPVALVQDQGIELQPKPAVLLFVPVYRRGLVPATLDARREALLGWVYAPFRPSDMMAPLVTDPSPLRGIRLFEESSAGERRELYRDDWSPPAGARPVAPVRASIEFLGRRWILEAEPGERLLTEGDSRRPEALLAIGTLMSLMIFAVIWSMSATRDRAHEIARSMTLALRTANEELDQRVAQRTGELVAVNHSLREQVAERELAERALAEALDKEARRNAQLRALADAGISIAALPDDEARFAYLAGQACRLTGCARAVLIPADGPTVAFAPDGIDDGEREWLLASSRHWPRSEQPGQVILPDAALDACGGRPLPDVSAVPVRAAGAPATDLLYLVHDPAHPPDVESLAIVSQLAALTAAAVATARATADERHARIEAESANAAKDRFLAAASHELRTPLQAILGWIDVIERRGGDHTLLHAASVVRRSAETQSALVEDLLDLARIRHEQLRIAHEIVDLADVARTVCESQRQVAIERGVAIELVLAGRHEVEGDALRLQQVMHNLLGNALKFTPAGGRILVRLRRDGGYQVLEVEDTGRGLAPELIARVFEPFSQGEGSSRRHGGLGLGLSLVRDIVERHGGEVSVASPGEGLGACFTVMLPVPRGLHDEGLAASDAGAQPAAWRLPGGVLLVDDNRDARQALAVWLREELIAATEFCEATAALDWLAACEPADWPSIVLCGLDMPGPEGPAFVAALRALEARLGRPAAVPVIAVGTGAGPTARARALADGFVDLLPRPVRPERVLEIAHGLAGAAGRPS